MVFLCLTACLPLAAPSQEGYWNLKRYVIESGPTMDIYISSVNATTGEVVFSVGDNAPQPGLLTWSWGDGQTETGGYYMRHLYQDLTKNYFVTVSAQYDDGATDSETTVVLFVPVQVEPRTLPTSLSVTIPDHPVTLGTHIPGRTPPTGLEPFEDSFFAIIPRAAAEYVLTAAAMVEEDFVNGDYIRIDGGFQQVILKDPTIVNWSAQAVWYASPPATAASDIEFRLPFRWGTFFHEMAHNFQANSPAVQCSGCWRMDGKGGAFMTETLAQMLQVLPSYELLNDRDYYGLGPEISVAIEVSTAHMVKYYHNANDSYLASGMPFTTYFNPPVITIRCPPRRHRRHDHSVFRSRGGAGPRVPRPVQAPDEGDTGLRPGVLRPLGFPERYAGRRALPLYLYGDGPIVRIQ